MGDHDSYRKLLQKQNPDADLESLKLTNREAWNSLDFKGIDKQQVMMSVARKQVLNHLHPKTEVQEALLLQGLDSSAKIVRYTKKEFTDTCSKKLGISAQEAEDIYSRSLRTYAKAMHLYAGVRTTAASAYYRTMNAGMAGSGLQEYFEKLPDYQELFGTLEGSCLDEQDTVLGMPAYFADLMRMTEKYITRPNSGSENFQKLSLRRRRPDLEKLLLTKENAENLVPYVKIILERLEYSVKQFLEKDDGSGKEEKELYEQLAEAEYPFGCPYVLPLTQIRLVLKICGSSVQEVLQAWNADAQAVYKEKLELSFRLEQILTEEASEPQIAERYGLADGELQKLNDPAELREAAKLSRGQLDDLLHQDLTEEESDLAALFYINQGLQESENKKYLFIDSQGRFVNAGPNVFDRINRFLRLEKQTGLSGDCLDWLLCVFADHGQITKDTLAFIGRFLELWEDSETGFYEFMSIFAPVKCYGAESLFDKIFCADKERECYHPAGAVNWHYADAVKTWKDEADTANWLAGCLGLSAADLKVLRTYIFGTEPVELTVENLSVFYRYGKMADICGFSVPVYLQYLEVCGLGHKKIYTLDEAGQLMAVQKNLKLSGLNLWQLQYLLTGQESDYVKRPYTDKSLQEFITTLWKQDIPYGAEERETAEQAVVHALAQFLGCPQEQIEKIAACYDAYSTAAYWVQSFLEQPQNMQEQPPFWNDIQKIMEITGMCLFLTGQGMAEEAAVSYFEHPEYYIQTDENKRNGLRRLYGLDAMIKKYNDMRLLSCLSWDAQTPALLESITNWPKDDICCLTEGMPVDVTGAQRLLSLQERFRILELTGTDSGLVVQLAKLPKMQQYEQLSGLAAKILPLYQRNQELENKIRSTKRDVLLEMLIWKLHGMYTDIRTVNDVYKYLLIDAGMDDTTQISYIKEGINAVQLYLQRCRMHLEQYAEKIEIEESWWQWMMSYRKWEANREIFIYPENYLVPSIRSTKTSLFREVEDGLQQARIEDGYVEKLYIKYLDDYSAVSDLDICGAYQAVTGVREETLFLFARSRQEPYQYYYCSKVQGMAYGEWQKIDAGIHSEYITPVYAFHKLYVFWIEQKTDTKEIVSQDSSGILSSDETAGKVDVKYTFLNLSGEWISPQTLIENQIITFCSKEIQTEQEKIGSPFAGVYDMEDANWKRVSLLRLTADNFAPYQKKDKDFERLCVCYGNFLNTTGETAEVSPAVQDGSDKNSYLQYRYELGNRHNILAGSLESGMLNAGIVRFYNNAMEEDHCLEKQEFLILDSRVPNGCICYRPLLDSVSHSVNLAYNNCPMVQEMSAAGLKVQHKPSQIQPGVFVSSSIDNNLSMEIYKLLSEAGLINGTHLIEEKVLSSDITEILYPLIIGKKMNSVLLSEVQKILYDNLPVRTLFSAAYDKNARILPVGGKQGSFLYNCGDEIFLLSPDDINQKQKVFCSTQEGMTAEIPPLGRVLLMKAGFPSDQADRIVQALKKAGLINDTGHIFPQKCSSDTVEAALSSLQLPYGAADTVLLLLQNSPCANPQTFIGKGIDKEMSQTIYSLYRENGLIDEKSGRVNRDLCSFAGPRLPLINLIRDRKLDENCLPEIFDKLVYSPSALVLNYENRLQEEEGSFVPDVRSIRDFVFHVYRLSNSSIRTLQKKVYLAGINELLSLKTQEIPPVAVLDFGRLKPGKGVVHPQAEDGTQVDFEGLYGEYNWEVFYHIPMLIADRLKTENEHEKAMRWFQFVFDPMAKDRLITGETFYEEAPEVINQANSRLFFDRLTANGLIADGHVSSGFHADTDLSFLCDQTVSEESITAARNILLNYQMADKNSFYWNFRPFRMHTLETLKEMLSDDHPAMQIYNNHPFDPHAVARLRIGAYEKYTVMQYIENLVNWADRMFSEDTWESNTSAAMLYILAYTLLGPKPETAKRGKKNRAVDFAELEKQYQGEIPQFLICLEAIAAETDNQPEDFSIEEVVPLHELDLYFGIPENRLLMQYWETIEDRLYKIRNSMNIAGIKRQLALNQPRIDPLELVKALAAENQIYGELAQERIQPYPYRFQTAVSHAKMLAKQAAEWSAALLGILEKQDAEHLRMLSDASETESLKMAEDMKIWQIQEQEETLRSLQVSQKAAEYRKNYYQNLLTAGLSSAERVSLEAMDTAAALGAAASLMRALAGAAHAMPQIGSPFAMTYGGVQVGGMLECCSAVIDLNAGLANYVSQRALTVAGYDRRAQEWMQQMDTADYEEQNIQGQIQAVNKRIDVCKRELEIHRKNIQAKQEISDYLKDRFTSEQLYQWMAGRMQGILSLAWQEALNQSLIAQDCYRRERDSNETFIQFQYWDSAKKGLLAAENLIQALQKMESCYYSKNCRSLEIEKNISLGLLCPDALYRLKTEGRCEFRLTEAMFAYDYPGCYARRIVSVSVSIPAVLGPYEHIKAVLRQTESAYVAQDDLEGVRYLLSGREGRKPDSVKEDFTPLRQIALSQGMDDSGMFVLNFQDERYLPFEGTGAVSGWILDMPKETNHFPFDSLTDIILHVKYTAFLSDQLKEQVAALLKREYPYTAGMFFNLRQSYQTAWEQFFANEQEMTGEAGTCCLEFPVKFYPDSYYAGAKVMGVLLRCSLKLTGNIGRYRIFRLRLPDREPEWIEMDGSIGCAGGICVDALKCQGQWVIEADLQEIAKVPQLSGLVQEGRLNPQVLTDMEMTILYERRYGDAGSISMAERKGASW